MSDITGYPYGKFPSGWEADVLNSLQAPVTVGNVHFLDSWEMFEQGTPPSAAAYNPFNTTQGGAGTTTPYSHLTGGGIIWNYKDWQSGLNATIATLTGSQAKDFHYDDIVNQLKSGNIQPGQDVVSKGFVKWGGYDDVNTKNYPNVASTDFGTCTLLGQLTGQCAPVDTAVPVGGPAPDPGITPIPTPSLSGVSKWVILGLGLFFLFMLIR